MREIINFAKFGFPFEFISIVYIDLNDVGITKN